MSDYYKAILNTRHKYYVEIMRALDIVRQFIIDRKLILVGGMGIDFALRLKGAKLYPDDEIPDYDFYSTAHAKDAYDLSVILCDAGFKDIACKPAIHITTMRVRIHGEPVADITYCPLNVFRKVPTLVYAELLFAHPHWQMIDQHVALSKPFEVAGASEVIFFRWKKDVARRDLIDKYYPLVQTEYDRESSGDSSIASSITRIGKVARIPLIKTHIPFDKIKGGCIAGWCGVNYTITDTGIDTYIPKGEHVTIYSNDYKKFIKVNKLKPLRYYAEYIGKLPRRVICESEIVDITGKKLTIEVYDVYGVLVAAVCVNKLTQTYLAGLQTVMVYLLCKMFSTSLPVLSELAKKQYLETYKKVSAGEFPIIEVYGDVSIPHSYFNYVKTLKESIFGIPTERVQPDVLYMRHGCKHDKSFDYSKSEYFMTDGMEIKEFLDLTLNPHESYSLDNPQGSIDDEKS